MNDKGFMYFLKYSFQLIVSRKHAAFVACMTQDLFDMFRCVRCHDNELACRLPQILIIMFFNDVFVKVKSVQQ